MTVGDERRCGWPVTACQAIADSHPLRQRSPCAAMPPCQADVRAVRPIAAGETVAVCCLGEPVGKGVRMEILRRGPAVLATRYGY